MLSLTHILCLFVACVSALPPFHSGRVQANFTPALASYSLPNASQNSKQRAADVNSQHDGFQYGPAAAAGPFSATALLGEARNKADTAIIMAELASQQEYEKSDYAKGNATKAQVRCEKSGRAYDRALD